MNTSIAACLALALCGDGGTTMSTPRTVTWKDLSRDVFDTRWILPATLPLASADDGESSDPGVDLASTMKRLAELVVEPSKSDAGAPRSLGDVALAVRAAGGGAKSVDAVLARVERGQPELWRAIAPFARELLCDERLAARKWDPDDDDGCDGLAFARPLTRANAKEAPWEKLEGSKLLQQCAVLIRADLEAIKESENDFTQYKSRPGANYEEIHATLGSFVRGRDASEHEFAAARTHFKCDLPFPFGDYACDLAMLNRIDAAGDLATDVYSTSRDFLWLAGRDVLLPLHGSDGTWAGTLLVRIFGFDLRGVPDGDSDRRAAMRSGLGCLKRESEAVFARYAGPARTKSGRVPEYAVRGAR